MQCEVRKKLGKQVVLQSIFYKSPSIFPGALKTVVNRKVLKCILSLIIDNHTFDECRSSLGLKLGSSQAGLASWGTFTETEKDGMKLALSNIHMAYCYCNTMGGACSCMNLIKYSLGHYIPLYHRGVYYFSFYQHFFSDQHFFLDQCFFSGLNFFGPKLFLGQIFFEPKIFLHQNFLFGPIIFLN